MMTPDLAMIAEVMLAAEGFREARILAKKTVTLYSLMIQQLSKQVCRRSFWRDYVSQSFFTCCNGRQDGVGLYSLGLCDVFRKETLALEPLHPVIAPGTK